MGRKDLELRNENDNNQASRLISRLLLELV